VASVTQEGPGVVSVLLEGRGLDRLPVGGGQFLQWRFLQPGMWWQAHPYSLSAVPAQDRLRITVKDLGDHSRSLSNLRPGTRVAIEGPYGAFTADARHSNRVLLVGAGVGTAPILALLQDLPREADVVVVLRASTPADLVLRAEVQQEVHRRRGRLVELVGPRTQVRIDADALLQIAPDLSRRDAFLCGPAGFNDALVQELQAAGVAGDHIHFESFEF
jgi:ferredoxin-NADP reductase